MALWDDLVGLVHRDAEHLERVVLLPDHVFPPLDSTAAVAAGESYFRLWAVQMFLRSDREWFKSWYPVVQSLTTFQFGNVSGAVEIAQVAGPNHLRNVDPGHLGQVLQLDHALTPLVPFSGGTVQIEAGLMAMQSSDLLQRFLDVMGSFAGLVTVAQLSAALTVADTLSKGIGQLLDVGGNRLVLGFQQTFAGVGGNGANALAPAYIALLNTASGTYLREQFWVKDSALLYGPDLARARELTGVDYMLLRIETRKNRDDWDKLSIINGPWTKAIEFLSQVDANGNPKVADAEVQIRIAAGAALNSPDLTNKDRMQVARAIRERYQEYKAALGLDMGDKAGLALLNAPTLAEVASGAERMGKAPITLGELFV